MMLNDKVALVAGASPTTGGDIAEALAEAGAEMVAIIAPFVAAHGNHSETPLPRAALPT
jgi:NAD(P)-dependent dehydrogenase (short-subunit alcohol dehydrogenase family)